MSLRNSTMVGVAILLVMLLGIGIIVVPAELLFRWNTGVWYGSSRNDMTLARDQNDFRLYREPFALQKHPGRIRILAVGGSTTYGMSVRANDTWPKRLEQKLNEAYPGKFEVINVAYLGGHLEGFVSDYHRVSRRYIPRDRWLDGERPADKDMAAWGWKDLDPDLIVVVPIVNDTAPDFTFIRSNGDARGWFRRMTSMLDTVPVIRNLAISYYLKVVINKFMPRAIASPSAEMVYARIGGLYKANLQRFVSLWSPSKPILLVGMPWLFNMGDTSEMLDDAMKVWNVTDRAELADELSYFPALEKIEVEARRNIGRKLAGSGVLVAEVGQALKRRPFRERLSFYLDPIHVNAAGYEHFASEICQLVVETPSVANFLRSPLEAR